jgi:hypothetical protein
VTQVTAKAVQIVAKDNVDLPGANRFHELIEPLALRVSATPKPQATFVEP